MDRRRSCRRCSDNRRLRDYLAWRCGNNHIAWGGRLRCSMRGTYSANRRLGDHGAGRRLGGNGRSRRRGRHDGSSLTRLRHNSAWGRLRRDRWRWRNLCRPLCDRSVCRRYRSRCNGCCRLGGNRLRGSRGHRRCGRGARRRRGSFFFLLLDRLEHVAGFRNARPVDLRFGGSGLDARTAGCAALAALEVSAHTLGFVEL